MTPEPMPPDTPPVVCLECKGAKQVTDEATGYPSNCKKCNGTGLVPRGFDTSNNLTLF